MKIKITKNGPYIVTGSIPLYSETIACDEKGNSVGFKEKEKIDSNGTYTLCRCGKSKNKPFCDGSHLKFDFDGTEVSSKKIYEESLTTFETNKIRLDDAIELCDHSRFCQNNEGIRKLIENGDSESIKIAKEQAANCPSGRLLIWDKEKKESTEKEYEKEIVILYDQGKDCEGPIWVKGKIPIEGEDGEFYENRNRITLCRCGKSKHKPFCDGKHWMSPEMENKFRKKWNLKDLE
ncbi:CDGSH iron-sulfur domain-containing protein [Methanobrevibacter sp.]|uniref:CDGSH iron-sulfur domain-containing protein n=1 Tax=Methanobrevibacter sp. TaxID=66852 RepID=UPI00261FFC7A|nr:CDGSH iron-sulfur domain-containing protein [uncultured Methanobrevibacter sp.]